jgi:hypothetical protein
MDPAVSAHAHPTVFQQVLGASFFNLPAPVRRLHAVRGSARYAGIATVERGRNPLARLCANIAGLPGAMREVPITVEFVADARGETWRRDFAGTRMHSRLACKGGLLRERIGPLQFRHALLANGGAIWWRVAGVRLFGLLPLPARWFRGVRCREREHEDRYEFLVEAALPLVGRVIRYEGWLAPVDDDAAA